MIMKSLVTIPIKRVMGMSVVIIGLALASACSDDDKQKNPRAHLVEIASVIKAPLEYTSDRAGSLRARRAVKIFNQEEGRVVKVLASEGDRVRKNRPLIRLDARLLQAELDKAEAKRRQAELSVARLQRLIPQKLVSEDALTRAQTELDIASANVRVLQTRVSYMTIRAPFYGEVAERRIEPGDVAPKHTHLMTVVDSTSLVTEVQVSELMLSRLKRNDRADVRIDALGATKYPGKISRIYPTIDPSTRQGRIEVALSPVPKGARSGQFCRVTLYSKSKEPLVIPFSALRRDQQGEYVFVVGEDNKVTRQPIVSGLRLTDRVEIVDGLVDGQMVVQKGFLGLSAGNKVKPVNLPPETLPKDIKVEKTATKKSTGDKQAPPTNSDGKETQDSSAIKTKAGKPGVEPVK